MDLVTFEQRFASACLLLLTGVLIYAGATGQLNASLAITSITGLIASLIAGKSIYDGIRKGSKDKETTDDKE